MRVRAWLPFVAVAYLSVVVAACGDPEDPTTDGALAVSLLCVNDGCGRTGTLITQWKDCDGAVLATTSAAGVTLNTASTGSPYVVTWEPVPAGQHCVNAMLQTTAGTVVSGTGGDVSVTIFHGERVTVRMNLGTLVP